MSTQYYFFKLIPPRPTFPQDMTAEEKDLMQQHASYMQELFAAGKVLLVAPGGAFGVAVAAVADEAEARQLSERDPSVTAGLNRFEVYPMQVAAARGL